MPVDVSRVVGADLPPLTFEYDEKTVITYALGVGAGSDPGDLKYVYENPPGLQVLPTFGVIPPFPALMGLGGLEGFRINLAMVLHGEQYLEVRKHPVPTSGTLTTKSKVANVYDKGKGALIEIEAETRDASGDVIYYNVFGVFARGEGGFGGERGPSAANRPPAREPDRVIEASTLPQQALLYRLSGDLNPLHADPSFAALAGYDRPILHGLCTMAIASRALLREYGGDDPSRFRSVGVRFSGHVFPGEGLLTEVWEEGDLLIFQVRTAGRGEVAISNAAMRLA